MRSGARTVVVLFAVLIAVFWDEVPAGVLAFICSIHFGVLMLTFGIAALIWLRMDRLDNDKERPATPAAAGPPALPRQRVSVEEGAA